MTISWREVNGSATPWTLAGRSDRPPGSRGESAAALVQFASTHLNQQSMNIQIQSQLRSLAPDAERRLLQAPAAHGVFAVARMVEARHPDGQRSLSSASVHLYPGTYRDPWGVFERERQSGTVSGLTGRASTRYVRRYFWGVLAEEPEAVAPRYLGGTRRGPVGGREAVRGGFSRRGERSTIKVRPR